MVNIPTTILNPGSIGNVNPAQVPEPSQALAPLERTLVNEGLAMIERESEQEGTQSGINEQMATGGKELKQRSELRASGRAFNRAADRVFLLQQRQDLQEKQQEITLRYGNDPVALQDAMEKLKQETLPNIPSRLQGAWALEFEESRVQAVGKAREVRFREEAAAATAMLVRQLNDANNNLTRLIMTGARPEEIAAAKQSRDELMALAERPTEEGYRFDPQVRERLRQGNIDVDASAELWRQWRAMGHEQRRSLMTKITTGEVRPQGMSEQGARAVAQDMRAIWSEDERRQAEARAVARERERDQQNANRIRTADEQEAQVKDFVERGDVVGLETYLGIQRQQAPTETDKARLDVNGREWVRRAEVVRATQGSSLPQLAETLKELASRAENAPTPEQRNQARQSAEDVGKVLTSRVNAANQNPIETAQQIRPSAFRDENGQPIDISTADGIRERQRRAAVVLGRAPEQVPAFTNSEIKVLQDELASGDPQRIAAARQRIASYGDLAPELAAKVASGDAAAGLRTQVAASPEFTDVRLRMDAARANYEKNKNTPGNQQLNDTQIRQSFITTYTGLAGDLESALYRIYTEQVRQLVADGMPAEDAFTAARRVTDRLVQKVEVSPPGLIPGISGAGKTVWVARGGAPLDEAAVSATYANLERDAHLWNINVGVSGDPTTRRTQDEVRQMVRNARLVEVNGVIYLRDAQTGQNITAFVNGQFHPVGIRRDGSLTIPQHQEPQQPTAPLPSLALPSPTTTTGRVRSPTDMARATVEAWARTVGTNGRVPYTAYDPAAAEYSTSPTQQMEISAVSHAMRANGIQDWMLDYFADNVRSFRDLRRNPMLRQRVMAAYQQNRDPEVVLNTGERVRGIKAFDVIVQRELRILDEER